MWLVHVQLDGAVQHWPALLLWTSGLTWLAGGPSSKGEKGGGMVQFLFDCGSEDI